MRPWGSSIQRLNRRNRQLTTLLCAVSMFLATFLLAPISSQLTSAALAQETNSSSWRTHGQIGTGRASVSNALPAPTPLSQRRAPHRLIRKPALASIAAPATTPSDPVVPSVPATTPTDATGSTNQATQQGNVASTSSSNSVMQNNGGALSSLSSAAPVAVPHSSSRSAATASSTTALGSSRVTAAASGSASASPSGSRSLGRLLAEMPQMSQMVNTPPPPPPPPDPTAPVINATPVSLSFSAQQGGANPASQTVTISNTGGGTLGWIASDNAAWLTLSPASGSGNGTVTVSAAIGSLAVGTYNTTITLSATGATTVSVPVTFTVTAAPVPPAIGASPASLSFTAQQGGSNPANQTVTIRNAGGGTLSWTASDNAAWLTLSPASGSGNGTVTVSAAIGSLAVGTYNTTITLSATGTTNVSVPVTFTVTAAPVPPAIGASPTSLSFTAQQGGSNPANQTVTISNTGGGTLSWTASDNAAWLTLSPASGTGNSTVTVTVATGTLSASTQTATITLAATGANPISIPVTFTVTAAPASTIGLSPVSLSFTGTQGAANPASKTVNVTNPGSGTLTWSASDNATWLTLSPASGTTTTETDPITASINTAGLAAGTYNASITITGTGSTNTPQTVPVVLTVNAPTTSSATLTWNANTESDLAGYRVYRATASGTYGAPVATVPAGTVTYQATGLTMNTTYWFTITAYDTAGNESLRSNEVSKTVF